MRGVFGPVAVMVGALLLCGAGLTEAVLVTSSTRILAYFLTACPTGWTDRNIDPYRGRVIKGTPANSGVGSTKNSAQTTLANPTHSHNSGWQMKTSTTNTAKMECAIFKSDKAMDDGTDYFISSSGATMSSEDGAVPSVMMNLCEYTGTSTITLPVGIVTFMGPTITTCPSGFAAFTAAEGRFLVFGGASVDLSSEQVSPATAVTTSLGDIGTHYHNIPDFSFNTLNTCTSASCLTGASGAEGGQTLTWTQTAAMGSTSLNIPYVQLVACVVTDATSNNVLPNSNAVFYYNGNTCPSAYREATGRSDGTYSNIVGRIIWNKYDSVGTPGQTWGGSQLTYALGTNTGTTESGHAGHSHAISISDYTFSPRFRAGCSWFTCSGSAGLACDGTNGFADYQTYSFSFSSSASVIPSSGTGLLPFRVMRACSPQAPTSSPTNQPTKSPTNAPTTQFPTESPTAKPTRSPSRSPSRTPSRTPSRAPTSSRPTKSPTAPTTLAPTTSRPTPPPVPTFGPSTSPSVSPTTSIPTVSPTNSAPTLSPTKAPAFLDLCIANLGDASKFVSYDNWFNYQAASCAAECRINLLTSSNVVDFCINNCQAFAGYSSSCLLCYQNFLKCQASNCQSCYVASTTYLAQACKTCATTACRPALATCTGFNSSVLLVPTVAPTNIGGTTGTGGGSLNLAPIIGGVLGGLAAALAGVFFVQRRRLNQQVENGLKLEWEDRLFKKAQEEQEFEMTLVPGATGISEAQMPNRAEAASAQDAGTIDGNVPLRTRFSFHGDPKTDELNIAAGASLVGVSKNRNWWVAIDEQTQTVGLIPASYVSEM